MPRRYIDRIYLREPVPADSYLSVLPAVRALGDREHPLLFPADVTFLVGENGTGKSTLLEAVAVSCGFNAEGGTRNFDFSTRATHSPSMSTSPWGGRPTPGTASFSGRRAFIMRLPILTPCPI